MRIGTGVVIMLVSGSGAAAAPIVDGTRDLDYGSPIVVQTVNSQFGDSDPDGGSELDAAYALVEGGRLYLLFTGNLQTNFNQLEVFIDSRAGGENVLTNTPMYDGNSSLKFSGMTFDAGFVPDFHMFANWGNNGEPFETNFYDRQGGANASVPGSVGTGSAPAGRISTGSIAAGNTAAGASGSALTQALEFAINNNNAGGVGAGTGAANAAAAAAVATGMEFSISLADLGSPGIGDVIRIAAMINGSNHDYLSNQVLGGLPAGSVNLGGTGDGTFTGSLSGVDFTEFAGNQYFEIRVVPAPMTGAAFAGGIAALVSRRRRGGT